MSTKVDTKKGPLKMGEYCILPLPITPNSNAKRYFLYRLHASKKSEASMLPSDRTLFVTNLPDTISEDDLAQIFSACGAIEKIYIKHIRKPLPDGQELEEGSFKVISFAHIVYQNAKSAKKALTSLILQNYVPTLTLLPQDGVKNWLLAYYKARPGTAQLQSKVDQFMQDFESQERKAKMEEEAKKNLRDEDGFITVGKAGASDGTVFFQAAAPEHVVTNKKKKKKTKELTDFYRFQQREAKREELADLRRKFEQDKSKIAKMRESRRFKPY
eukprot:GILK01009130.1.p1 GENE.GILK01009130.1~~GILK01009130.1.p1  ORF type:complete len:282 (-),score=59.91 GILK01009130.1:197-1012(-)